LCVQHMLRWWRHHSTFLGCFTLRRWLRLDKGCYPFEHFQWRSRWGFLCLDKLVYCRSEKMLTHRRNQYHFGFSSVLTIFGYEKSNAEWCQAEKLPQKGQFRISKWPLKWPLKHEKVNKAIMLWARLGPRAPPHIGEPIFFWTVMTHDHEIDW
jgi:hypothetical protein